MVRQALRGRRARRNDRLGRTGRRARRLLRRWLLGVRRNGDGRVGRRSKYLWRRCGKRSNAGHKRHNMHMSDTRLRAPGRTAAVARTVPQLGGRRKALPRRWPTRGAVAASIARTNSGLSGSLLPNRPRLAIAVARSAKITAESSGPLLPRQPSRTVAITWAAGGVFGESGAAGIKSLGGSRGADKGWDQRSDERPCETRRSQIGNSWPQAARRLSGIDFPPAV